MATVTVTNTDRQEIIGWEGTAQEGQTIIAGSNEVYEYPSSTYPNYADNIIAAKLDFGINCLRVEVYLDDETTDAWNAGLHRTAVNDNADANVINAAGFDFTRIDQQMVDVVVPYKNALRAATGENLFINLCIVDFRSAGFRAEDTPAEYAEFVLAAVDYIFDTYGITVDAVETILEPATGENTASWTAAKVADNIVAAEARLATAGYTIKFIAPSLENGNDTTTWYTNMKTQNAAVASKLLALSFHGYVGIDNAGLTSIYNAANTDSLKTMMLEKIGASLDDLLPMLQHGRISMFQQYAVAYPWSGGTDTGGKYFNVNTSTWAVTPYVRTQWLRFPFKYVRRGAFVKTTSIGGTNAANITYAIAFQNPNLSWVILLRTNAAVDVDITGIGNGTYGVRYTLGSNTNNAPSSYDQSLSDQVVTTGATGTISIPGEGVAVVFDVNYLLPPSAKPKRRPRIANYQ